VSAVFSTSQTAVALGINGGMAKSETEGR
jgi:hypothetical protein